ncbi:MAG TPA: hypothetical protein VGM26_06595 [Rhizomicrobium sp.]|jgi:probable addiction module antidote protein
MTTKTTKFDFSDYLTTPELIAAHLDFAFEQGEAEFAKALGDVARARGMTEIANLPASRGANFIRPLALKEIQN